jgi:Family of unknown function (DUF6524)
MAIKSFNFFDFLVRLVLALLLVFLTYNPSGYSWYHWFSQSVDKFEPAIILAGLVLIIGWAIYLRSTARSLGMLGIMLAAAFFATLIWLMVDQGLLSVDNPTVFTYVVLVALSAVMATGISWSHIRRKMSGQLDVDDVEGD